MRPSQDPGLLLGLRVYSFHARDAIFGIQQQENGWVKKGLTLLSALIILWETMEVGWGDIIRWNSVRIFLFFPGGEWALQPFRRKRGPRPSVSFVFEGDLCVDPNAGSIPLPPNSGAIHRLPSGGCPLGRIVEHLREHALAQNNLKTRGGRVGRHLRWSVSWSLLKLHGSEFKKRKRKTIK